MNIDQRRRLTDLYARGEEIALGDDGDTLVWVRKMTPADAEAAYVKANARRSSVLAMAKEEEPSDFYLMLKGEIAGLTREAMITWIASSEIGLRTDLIRAEIAGNEEWSKEKYLSSLQERYNDEDFRKKLVDTPEDAEVVRVLGELERYQKEADAAIDSAYKELEKETGLDSDDELRERILKAMLESQGDAAWLSEFNRCQVWRCVFWGDDHREKVFPTRQDVDEVQIEVLNRLQEVLSRIHVVDLEGKDLQQTPDSLPPSE